MYTGTFNLSNCLCFISSDKVIVEPTIRTLWTGSKIVVDRKCQKITEQTRFCGLKLPMSTYSFNDVFRVGRKRQNISFYWTARAERRPKIHMITYELSICLKSGKKIKVLTALGSWDAPPGPNPILGWSVTEDYEFALFESLEGAIREVIGLPSEYERLAGVDDQTLVMYECPNCGKTITAGLKRCYYCFHPLEEFEQKSKIDENTT